MKSLGALPFAAACAGLVCALSGEAHAAGVLLPSVAGDQAPAIDDHAEASNAGVWKAASSPSLEPAR